MASIYDLKSKFQGLLRPLNAHWVKRGVTANQVTLFALILSLVTGGLLVMFGGARWVLLWVPVVLLVRMALNAIDGMLAREHDMKSALGAVLNEIGDVVSDAAIYLPFGYLWGVNGALVVAVVVLGIVTEMTGVIGVQIGASRRYDGPMGKSDRAFVFGVIALIVGLGVDPELWVNAVLGVMCVLLVWTVVNRVRGALKELDPSMGH